MDSAYETSHIRKLQAQHKRMQEKTFTNWINNIFQHGRVSASGRARQPASTVPPLLPGQWTLGAGQVVIWLRLRIPDPRAQLKPILLTLKPT